MTARQNAHFASELTELMNIQMLTATKTLTEEQIEESIQANRLFPTTKHQAECFLNSEYGCWCELGAKDVAMIEELLSKHGLQGRYQYTKSRKTVHFLSSAYIEQALQQEYSL